jgi:hypothetical protein
MSGLLHMDGAETFVLSCSELADCIDTQSGVQASSR